ncbi:MAG: short-subunit dehydrogenase [Cellvibrionaceae bacterium]|jgi:short-subunit dehydrogenase
MTSQTIENQPIARPLEPKPAAIVVGASTGIGAALVKDLAKRGYHVAALARREDKLTELAKKIKANPSIQTKVITRVHNVTDFDTIPPLFAELVDEMGGLDLILYVAGVMPNVAADEYDFEKDRQQVEVNLLGAMGWLNLAARRFQITKSGTIVGIGSVAGDRGRKGNPAYHTTKGGLAIYLESLRNRLSEHGVCVTTIKPGFVDTVNLEGLEKTFWVISPEKAASLILNAAEKKRQVAYVPFQWRFLMLIIQHIPSFIFRKLSI